MSKLSDREKFDIGPSVPAEALPIVVRFAKFLQFVRKGKGDLICEVCSTSSWTLHDDLEEGRGIRMAKFGGLDPSLVQCVPFSCSYCGNLKFFRTETVAERLEEAETNS